jgi:hypothetical protein
MVANPDAGGAGGGTLIEANPDELVVGGGRVSYTWRGGGGFPEDVAGGWVFGNVLAAGLERGEAGLAGGAYERSAAGGGPWVGPLVDIEGSVLGGGFG